jgi:hypothetical protein
MGDGNGYPSDGEGVRGDRSTVEGYMIGGEGIAI